MFKRPQHLPNDGKINDVLRVPATVHKAVVANFRRASPNYSVKLALVCVTLLLQHRTKRCRLSRVRLRAFGFQPMGCVMSPSRRRVSATVYKIVVDSTTCLGSNPSEKNSVQLIVLV